MARKLVFDRLLFGVTVLLVGLGLVMVYSATSVLVSDSGMRNPLFIKQVLAALVGLGAMVGIMHLDYRWLRRPEVVYSVFAGTAALLIAVLSAPTLNNTKRWLFVGGVSIQPSELAKLALVLYLAYQIAKKRERLNHWSTLLPCGLATALLIGLILGGRDLGTAVLLLVPAFLMVFLAGLSWRYLAAGGLALLPVLALATWLDPYRVARLTNFLDPAADPTGGGFQGLQSLIAIGSGGVGGLGLGGSVQKLYFLPSPHADFVFAIVAEELGLIGAVGLVSLFAVFFWRGMRAGLRAPDDFGRYLAWGCTLLIVVQALIHVSVTLLLLPTTGVPLPFISHGGTSLITTLLACGLILNVSQHA
ncbi:MAG: putative lipid II flippase FtsW [Acidobacteriota bacterium]